MKIAFFDSGIGGLTVLNIALKELPNSNFIFFADTENVPYGTKSKAEVKKLVIDAVDFIANLDVDALVIACNTATSIAIKDIRAKYNFPVIGMEPAVKPAVESNNCKRVLVTATPLTLKEEKFQNLVERIDTENIVDLLPLPELVKYAEDFIFEDSIIIPYLEEKLKLFNLNNYSTIVLGCTHFPYFQSHFRKIIPEHIEIIDGNLGTVRQLKNVLSEKIEIQTINVNSSIEFYSSKILQTDSSRYLKYIARLNTNSKGKTI